MFNSKNNTMANSSMECRKYGQQALSIVSSSNRTNFMFLIDTSRSMYYTLRAVKKVLIDALFDLLEKPDAYFNVIAFNTRLDSWVSCTSLIILEKKTKN